MTGIQTDPDLPRLHVGRAERYRHCGWWRAECLEELVLRHGCASGQKSAVAAGQERLTYCDLERAVGYAATQLRGLGISRGDTVVVQLPNVLEFVVLVLALVRLGARPVLTMPALRHHELNHIVTLTQPVAMAVAPQRRFDHLALARQLQREHRCLRMLLVVDDDASGEVNLTRLCRGDRDAELVLSSDQLQRSPSDVALFLLSSGTTGRPKVIPRTHEDYGCAIRSAAGVSGLSEESVYLALMPVTHSFVFGHPGILGTLASGGRIVLGTADDPRRAFELIQRERVTHCALVPALVTQWLAAAKESRPDLSSLRVLQVGGAKLSAAEARQVPETIGCRVQQVYGMSEGLLNFTRLDDSYEVWTETQGRPASPGDEIVIVDETGGEVAPGQTGELLTRGPYTIAGYYRDPDANARSFTADGFYRTGDLVHWHPSGNLVVAGRVKDVINRGGEKIAADELEELVLQDPRITSAAAVAMPHAIFGEAVCLFVVLRDAEQLELHEVRRFLESCGVAPFKLPERLEVVNSLPLIGVGKVNKVALRKDIAARLAGETER